MRTNRTEGINGQHLPRQPRYAKKTLRRNANGQSFPEILAVANDGNDEMKKAAEAGTSKAAKATHH